MNEISVTVQNNTSRNLYVTGDPNWDDQVLWINHKLAHGAFLISVGLSALVSMKWDESPPNENMMGIIISEASNPDDGSGGFYQLTIGENPSAQKMSVTDSYVYGAVKEKYIEVGQSAWSLALVFSNT